MNQARRSAPAIGLAIALAGTAPAAAGEILTEFAAQAPIALEGTGPYYQLALPIEVHFTSDFTDTHDLRVFNGQGETVPFSLIRERRSAAQALQSSPVSWFPLYGGDAKPESLPEIRVERRADGTVVSVKQGEDGGAGGNRLRGYLLDISHSKHPAHELELEWDPTVTGFQEIRVEASDDLQSWRTWRASVQLARFEYNGHDIERKEISLPDQRAEYVRLIWQEPKTAPALSSITLTTAAPDYFPERFLWSIPTLPTRASASAYEWTFPRLVGVERLRIGLPQVNVVAPIEVWGKDDREAAGQGQLLARAVLYRLRIDDREWEQQEVPLSGWPARSITLKLDERGGGLGAGMPSLSLGLAPQHLLFLARGRGPFVLAVGAAGAKPADLSPTTLIPGYGTPAAPPIAAARLDSIGTMAAAKAAPPVEPPGATSVPVTWKTAVLWAVLLAVVASIAAMALHLLRQTQR